MHKKTLDPLPETPGILQSPLKLKHPGTTQWFFEDSKYTAWSFRVLYSARLVKNLLVSRCWLHP